MKNFLSCDWGTSSFRLRYIDVSALTFVSVESTDKGIAKTFELWKQSGKKEEERLSFYINVIKDHIPLLEKQLGFSVKDIPLVISGMASSSIGMMDVAYRDVPFAADGSELEVRKIKSRDDFNHDIIIVSGAKTNEDVMRGEETQLAGCSHHQDQEELFILPGTHSKHILIKNRRVTGFKTYMTGEFFELLSQKSILSVAVQKKEASGNAVSMDSFEKGIMDSAQSNILHTSFRVRTNDLFGKIDKEANYYYLSGLLIGTEVRAIEDIGHKKVILIANDAMRPFYIAALNSLGSGSLKEENADMALVKGQLAILNRLKSAE